MSQINVEQVKKLLADAHERRARLRRAVWSNGPSDNQKAADHLMRQYLSTTGLDLQALERVRDETRNEAEERAARVKEEMHKTAATESAAYRNALEARVATLERLSNVGSISPLLPTIYTLNEPFLIWQFPVYETDRIKQTNIGNYDSWIKFAFQQSSGGDETNLSFLFLWTNDSDESAIIDINTGVTVNGLASLSAASGFWSGDACGFLFQSAMTILQLGKSGAAAYPAYQQSQVQEGPSGSIEGGNVFSWGKPNAISIPVNHVPILMSYSMLEVDARQSIVVEAALRVNEGFSAGGLNLADYVDLDFWSEESYGMFCPLVTITKYPQVFTQPPLPVRTAGGC